MKKLSIIKVLFAFLLPFSSSGLWASISWDESTKTLTLDNPTQDDLNNLNNSYGTQCQQTVRLVVKGSFTGWDNIRGKFPQSETSQTLQEIDLTDYALDADGKMSYQPTFTDAYGNISVLKLPTRLTEVPSSLCVGMSNLTSITIPNTVVTIGEKAFQDCTRLSSIVFQPESHVATLKSNCFCRTNFSTFTFPNSLKLIEENAFNECNKLITMTFPEGISDLVIKGGNAEGGAFSNCTNIKDVYIETLNEITCEVDTYPWQITYGQGDPNANFATLHFPPSQADYYTNMKHALSIDVASDPGRFHNWLMKHVQLANENVSATNNGWWQFINAGASDPTPPTPLPADGKFLKTFSDPNFARIVPNGVKAYIVTGVTPKTSSAGEKYFEVSLMIVNVIPRNTGVILFGEPNAISKDGTGKILTMTVVSLCEDEDRATLNYDENGNCITLNADGQPEPQALLDGTIVRDQTGQYVRTVDLSLRRKNWSYLATQDVLHKNYLEPSTVGDAERTHLQPYKVEDDGYAYRYFGFSHYRKSATGKKDTKHAADYDYAGFFRCKDSDITPGKAYLKLRADEYAHPEGGEVIIPETCQTITYFDQTEGSDVTFDYKDEYETGSGWQKWTEASPYWHHAIWELKEMFGKRDSIEKQPSALGKFDGEVEFIEDLDEGVATMIINAGADDSHEGDYYTLQGVKVNHPSKGVYIVNGKKVVIR